MKLRPINNSNDLTAYHDSVGEMVRSSTKATYQDISRNVKEALESLWIEKSRVLITWSDARSENPIFLRQQSPWELIITAKTGGWVLARNLLDIEEELKRQGFKVWEIKWLDDSRMLYKWDRHAVFPTRIYDAVIAENFEISPSERWLLFEEIRKSNHHTIEYFFKKLKSAQKAMKTGMSRIRWEDRKEVDFDNNLFHYDKKNFQNGVKTWPIRLVQYGLMRFIINRVRNDQSCEVDLMLPSNILDRIDALKSSWILPLTSQEVEDLKFAYWYLLYMHHMMQLGHIESGQTDFEISPDEMRDVKKMFFDLEKIIDKISHK